MGKSYGIFVLDSWAGFGYDRGRMGEKEHCFVCHELDCPRSSPCAGLLTLARKE